MVLDVVSTEDGSITCRDPVTGELYHNRAGAYTEALHNFVEPCEIAKICAEVDAITVLDICFGLGYNTFVLLDTLSRHRCESSVSILGLDKDAEILKLIPSVLADKRFQSIRTNMRDTREDSPEEWAPCKFGFYEYSMGEDSQFHVRIELRQVDIRKEVSVLSTSNTSQFDIIFHDSFSPHKIPELWTVDLFHCYKSLLKGHGHIVTYSSAAAVRGAFMEAGFAVWRTRPVGGKSGGTMACLPGQGKASEVIYPLTEDELLRINSASGVPYRDPGLVNSREQIRLERDKEQKQLIAVNNTKSEDRET